MTNYELISTTDQVLSSKIFFIKDLKTKQQLKVISYPTENCQTFLIAPFRLLFYSDNMYSKAMNRVQEIRTLCKLTQRLCYIDVRLELFKSLEPHIKLYTHVEYLNLTGNKMVMGLIHITN